MNGKNSTPRKSAGREPAWRLTASRPITSWRHAWCLAFIFLLPCIATGQEAEDDDSIDPTRPLVSESATVQRPGVLQVEYGADASFSADDYRSQTTAPTATAQATVWQRYSMTDEGFAVSLPEQPIVYVTRRDDKELFAAPKRAVYYSAYVNGMIYIVASFVKLNGDETAKDALPEFGAKTQTTRIAALDESKGDGFARARFVTEHLTGVATSEATYGVVDAWTTRRRIYFVQVIGATDKNPAAQKFIASFLLKNAEAKQPTVARATDSTAREVKAETLVDFVSENAATTASSSATSPSTTTPEVSRASEVAQRARVLLRLQPGYTDRARKNNVSGIVRLRAVLTASGRVTGVRAIKELSDGLTENAITAARSIRFIPAVKDGRFVSQYVVLEYSFTLY